MRSAEREGKSVVFHAAEGRMVFAARSEGGVRHDSDKKCGKAAFLYLSHSAVVIPCKSALPLPTREKGWDESDPPQKKAGGHVTPIAVLSGVPLSRSHGGRSRPHLSLREGSEKPPFPLALHRVGSVLAVKCSLRRFAPWTAPRPVQPSGSSALSRPRKCSIMARPMVPFPLAFDSARSVLAVKGPASVAGIGLKRDTVHDTFMALSSRTKRYGDSMNEMTPAV